MSSRLGPRPSSVTTWASSTMISRIRGSVGVIRACYVLVPLEVEALRSYDHYAGVHEEAVCARPSMSKSNPPWEERTVTLLGSASRRSVLSCRRVPVGARITAMLLLLHRTRLQ